MHSAMQTVLVTDYGVIPMPEDMEKLCRVRKDGGPDRRFSGAKQWHARFREESDKMQTAWVKG